MRQTGSRKKPLDARPLPDEIEWGVIDKSDVDLVAAFRDYFGKSCDQLHASFVRSPLSMVDSLRWMPLRPFTYYLRCMTEFVSNGDFDRSQCADLASSFIDLLDEKAVTCPAGIAANATSVRLVLAQLSKGQHLYDADSTIYGSFHDRCWQVEEKMNKMLGGGGFYLQLRQ